MLVLSDASLFMVLKFLQVLLWISIPALFIALLITTLVHYSRKKRQKLRGDEPASSKDLADHTLPSPVYPLPGSRHEVKKLRHELSRSNARYIAIRRDFEILTKKFQRLYTNIHKDSETTKKETMETIHMDMPQSYREEMENLKRHHENEKKELHAELN